MENFIVSARKYRPATFASVVGQKHITSTLKNAIERGQLAHAYLFCGPRGVGKTTCARIFAKAINCLHPEGAEACNDCESCRSFNENRSLNIHELDAASNNSVDDIRNLIEQVRILPQGGRYSVFMRSRTCASAAACFSRSNFSIRVLKLRVSRRMVCRKISGVVGCVRRMVSTKASKRSLMTSALGFEKQSKTKASASTRDRYDANSGCMVHCPLNPRLMQ